MICGAYFNKNVVKNPFNCALRSFHLTFNWKQSIHEVKTRVLWEQVVSKFPGGTRGKGPIGLCRRCGFNPWIGKIPWRRKWQPIPVFLPGEPHGQRSLAGSSPWDHKESDATGVNQQSTEHKHPITPHTDQHLVSIRSFDLATFKTQMFSCFVVANLCFPH